MGKTILLVDDDPSFLAMLGLALRRWGFTVETASGAEAALERLARRPFDWLVTDFGMSPMDGRELCGRARELRPGLRIAVVSGLGDNEGARSCGAELVYAKPVPLEKLRKDLSGRER